MSPEKRALKRILVLCAGAVVCGLLGAVIATFIPPMYIAAGGVLIGLYYALRVLYEMYVAQEKFKDTLK